MSQFIAVLPHLRQSAVASGQCTLSQRLFRSATRSPGKWPQARSSGVERFGCQRRLHRTWSCHPSCLKARKATQMRASRKEVFPDFLSRTSDASADGSTPVSWASAITWADEAGYCSRCWDVQAGELKRRSQLLGRPCLGIGHVLQ